MIYIYLFIYLKSSGLKLGVNGLGPSDLRSCFIVYLKALHNFQHTQACVVFWKHFPSIYPYILQTEKPLYTNTY